MGCTITFCSLVILDGAMDIDITANKGVLEFLRTIRDNYTSLLAPPDSVTDPYMSQGSHPDIVKRLWDKLGTVLPEDCRYLVCGSPALVHQRSGIVLAIAVGTQYALRIPPDCRQEAKQVGAKLSTKWSNGSVWNVRLTLGYDWVLGSWLSNEEQWCRIVYDHIEEGTGLM
jgi:hypothetical protein